MMSELRFRLPPISVKNLTARVQLVLCAAVNADRASIGLEAMRHGKDFMTDKPGVTTKPPSRVTSSTLVGSSSRPALSFMREPLPRPRPD